MVVRVILSLVLLLVMGAGVSPAADAPDNPLITRSLDGQVTLRSLRPSGGVADFLPYAPDELLVRFKDSATPTMRSAVHGRFKANTIKLFRHVNGLELVKLPPDVSIHVAMKAYRDNRDILYAEPNYLVEKLAVPNDPSFPMQWNLRNIMAPEAWDITTGSENVVVAVIDTGVDYNHQDLAANMWRNDADCNNNGVDDDGNGYVDDCHGIDTFNDDSDPIDDDNHGSHVSGIIGAVGNNSIGVVGVSWNVKIMACKFMGADGFGTTADAIACLDYVKTMKDRGVNIVATNNSWGAYGYSQALYDAIQAQLVRGVLFVAAAGNYASNNDAMPFYPASYELSNIISVAASSVFDLPADFTNAGRATVHLLAPGTDILSTTRGNSYGVFSGTSMAAAHVTGLAALLKSQDALRDWRAIRNLILAGGSDLHEFYKHILMTAKRANAYGSLTCANSVVYGRVSPRQGFTTRPIPIKFAVQHINCANPNGAVSLTINPGNIKLLLRDDGVSPDEVANDGVYTGLWLPTAGGVYTIRFPDGPVMPHQDEIAITVDPDLKPGFPVKTFHDAGTYMGGQSLHTLVANIDHDPNPEIIVTGLANGPLYAWKFDGSPVTGWPLEEFLGAGYSAAGELSTAFPGSEIFVGYYWSGSNHTKLWAYSGSGTTLPGWPRTVANFITSPPALADVDGDGIDEIFIAEEDWRLHGYRADGSAVPGWPTPFSPVGSQDRHTPAIADLDGDGNLELVTQSGDRLLAYHHDGTPVTGFPVSINATGRFPAIGDVDGDGKLEIIFPVWIPPDGATPGGYGVRIISWNGVIKRTTRAAGTIDYTSAPALADLDGDGIPEVILQTDGALNVWRGDGSNFPGWPVAVPGKMFSSAPVVGDVDGDGLPEIVITSTPLGREIGSVWVFNRNGALHPSFPKTLPIGSSSVPAIADLDRDGRNEVIITGSYWDGIGGDLYQVWVYDLGGTAHGAVQWGQLMGGPKHQGVYTGGYNIPRRFLLSVGKEGAGSGTVSSDIPGINCGSDCSEAFGSAVIVTLSAVATPGSIFLGWHGAGCSGTGTCTVSVTADSVVTAAFVSQDLTFRYLYVSSLNPQAGVNIAVNLADVTGKGSGDTAFNRLYYSNAVITLTAPLTVGGNVFQKWLRDGVDWATTPATEVIMAVDHTMTAVYQPLAETRILTVASVNPASGVMINTIPNDKNGTGLGSTQFALTYKSNAIVTLTAPSTAGGNDFSQWSGCYSWSSNWCEVIMTEDKAVTAVYGTPPESNITSGPIGTIATNGATFTWTGTDSVTPTGNLQYSYRLAPIESSYSAFSTATSASYTNLANGNYTFHVKAKNELGAEDLTPASRTFSVNAPLQVRTPNGGETWSIGSIRAVQWNSNGLNGKIRVQLSRDGGLTWRTLFARSANDGAQNWRVTKPTTNQGRIRVCSLNNPLVCDMSDANFVIR